MLLIRVTKVGRPRTYEVSIGYLEKIWANAARIDGIYTLCKLSNFNYRIDFSNQVFAWEFIKITLPCFA
jgi:hypothetical protein